MPGEEIEPNVNRERREGTSRLKPEGKSRRTWIRMRMDANAQTNLSRLDGEASRE